jgi:hypothetical protein
METVAVNKFTRFYNFLANMGLVLRDDPPKIIDMTGREWGDAVDGLTLSIRELKRDDPGQVAGISIVIRNGSADAKVLNIPPWIAVYEIEGLELSAYGRQVLKSNQNTKNTGVTLKPGDAVETEIPIAMLYNMRGAGNYTIRVSGQLPDGAVLRSNELGIRV